MSEANSRACASPGLDPPLGRVPRTPSLAAAHEAELHLLELRARRTLKTECTCFAYTQTAVRMPPARCPAGAPCMAHHRSTPFADEYELVLCSDLRAEALTLLAAENERQVGAASEGTRSNGSGTFAV